MNRKYKGGGCGCASSSVLGLGQAGGSNTKPLANVFIEKNSAGGGILENVGSFFGFNNTQATNQNGTVAPTPVAYVSTNTNFNSTKPANTQAANTQPANTTMTGNTSINNSGLPTPSSIVNKPANATPVQNSTTGGKEDSILNSFFGGYRATRRNKKYLKRYKSGKSIGFTMRSSLKAKGLIRRSNGKYRVSKKYRG